jgi:hypothetical protein
LVLFEDIIDSLFQIENTYSYRKNVRTGKATHFTFAGILSSKGGEILLKTRR